MNKKQWIDEIRQEILQTAGALGEDNLSERAAILREYATILEALSRLPGTGEPGSFEARGELRESKDEINHVYVGRLRRELSGGTIGSFRIYVPESVVRNLRMEEGDWVRARAVKSIVLKNGNMRTMYDYTVVRKEEAAEETGRRALAFLRVAYDPADDGLVLETEELGRVPVPPGDARNLDLTDGDLVDYAYHRDNPAAGRVIWKYKLPAAPVRARAVEEPDRLKAGRFFPERSFVVVGRLKEALRIQEEIEEYGGIVSFLTGDERFDIMERIGTGGDTAVVVLDSVTPHGLSKINDIGEKHGIPMLYTLETGAASFVQLLMDAEPAVPQKAEI